MSDTTKEPCVYITAEELLDMEFDDTLRDGQQWNHWRFIKSNLTLVFIADDGREMYEVDLETIHNSASMLDWIFQIQGKRWATKPDLGDLLDAFEHIFHPQRTLCSMGQHLQIDPTKYLRRRLANEKQKGTHS